MTENTAPAPLVAGVHRRIRILDPQEGPFAGELVADGDEVRVKSDAAGCADASFWAFGGADHIAGAIDLVRRADGMDVLLPWCTETVAAFIGRRAAAERAIGTGESVTLVGSLLRGIVELAGSPAPGTWWLTDGGRPVFVLGAGESAPEATRALLTRVRAGTTDRSLERLLADIESGLAEPRAARRRMDRWEAELTELAAPQPLRREVFAPALAGVVAEKRFPAAVEVRDDEAAGWRALLTQRVGPMTAAVRRALLRTRPRTRRDRLVGARPEPEAGARNRGAGRRRPLLIGAAAATIVLAAGLLWPTGDPDEPASAQAMERSDHAEPVPDASAPTASPEVVRTDDPTAAVSTLLKRMQRCLREHDERCADAVVDGAAAAVLTAVEESDATDAVALVDSYGDIAVIRRGDSGKEQQILVLLRRKDEWLVRDVYAVADQPGSS